MCGIAGLFDPSCLLHPDILRKWTANMAATLTHRGPDDSGFWSDRDYGVSLGHRRLSVIELGFAGAQPMLSPDRRWVIAYNGEIYNHLAMRKKLIGDGASFRGGSDTEVLVMALQAWGLERTLEACEGMFAFALWDRHRNELHLVRDRFGEKPLYYGWVGQQLAFASELKALCSLPEFHADIDRDAVALYLRHNCVPAPLTIYKNVAKLLPGEIVTVGTNASPHRPVSSRTYWSARQVVENARREKLDGPLDVLADQLEVVLSASVATRMVSDVPIGAFLSGGVDSSAVVALMQQHSMQPVRTFTIGFDNSAFDESASAAGVAAHLGTDHTTLRLKQEDGVEVINLIGDIWDEPFGDVSQIPMYLVSRLAHSQVTVALSGDGGDEIFAGYNRHAWLERLWHYSSPLPDPVRQLTGRALQRMPAALFDSATRVTKIMPPRLQIRGLASKVGKVGKVLAASSPEDAYLSLVSYWNNAESMVVGAGATGSVASRPADWPALDGITEQMLWLDQVSYLPDDILTKLDRASMACSLETRVPFLDRAVFDLAWRLPMSAKLHEGVTKLILRQVLYRYVPAELVDRPKMGFGFPIGPLLRGSLRPWAEELLDERRLRRQGLLDPETIRTAWRLHLSGRRDLGNELWAILVLQAWLDRWKPNMD